MRLIFLLTLIALAAVIWPALSMQGGWIGRMVRRLRVVAAAYVIALVLITVFRIVTGFDDIY